MTYGRRWNDARYVFAINDNRTFGDYVGPWGLVMEKGMPIEGEVSLADGEGAVKAVYELSRGGEVPFTRADGRVKVPVKYDTNDGRLFAFLPSKIESVSIEVNVEGSRFVATADGTKSVPPVAHGGKLSATMTVKDTQDKPVEALLPAEIRLYDAAGREIDGGGFVCAEGGSCTVEFLTNLNDAPGDYRIICRDRASGLSAERSIKSPAIND